MTDLRQGVTPAGHDVFDEADRLRPVAQIVPMARMRADILDIIGHPMRRCDRRKLVEAAALALLLVERMDD